MALVIQQIWQAISNCSKYIQLMQTDQEDNLNRLTTPLEPHSLLYCQHQISIHHGKAKQSRYGQATCISAADWASTILNNALRQALVNPCQPLLSVCLISLAPLFHGHHSRRLSPQRQLLSGPDCPLLKDVAPQPAGAEPPHLRLQATLAQLLNGIVSGLSYTPNKRVTMAIGKE